MRFSKYHALGNDYLVIEADEFPPLTPALIRRLCDRHYGVGSDGLLVRQPDASGRFSVRIYNPDGSETEKSGNGLCIFCRYLWDHRLVGDDPFQVVTLGGVVTCQMREQGRMVTIEMGRVSFHSRDIPVAGPPREVLLEEMDVGGKIVKYSAATIGNPHCVLVREHVSEAEARALGPLIENAPRFPNRTNVQLLEILDRRNIRIEIWERGAGYTLASGSSSCAAAAVAHRLGLCDPAVTVHMPGGQLQIEIGADFQARMTGPVTRVAFGEVASEVFSSSACPSSDG